MAGRYDKPGSQGEWPYPGSGPSGSSDTEAGLARLEALGNVGECDLPSRQGEGDTPPQGDRASAADALRASLRGVADFREPTAPAAPSTPEDIRAALRDGVGVHEAPVSSLSATEVPPTVAEINTKAVEANEKWQTEKELRETLAAVTNAKEQLKALQAEIARAEEYNRAIDPDAVREIAGKMHESLEGVNPYFLNKAATIVGTAAHQDAVALEGMHKQYNELG